MLDQVHHPIDTQLQADLVGLSVWTASAPNAYHLADIFRARGGPVVLGGSHVAVLPEEARVHAGAIVMGEAEAIWAQQLSWFTFGMGCFKPRMTTSR